MLPLSVLYDNMYVCSWRGEGSQSLRPSIFENIWVILDEGGGWRVWNKQLMMIIFLWASTGSSSECVSVWIKSPRTINNYMIVISFIYFKEQNKSCMHGITIFKTYLCARQHFKWYFFQSRTFCNSFEATSGFVI